MTCFQDRAWGDHWEEATGEKMELNPHIPKPDPPKEETEKKEAEGEKKESEEKKEGDEKEKADENKEKVSAVVERCVDMTKLMKIIT